MSVRDRRRMTYGDDLVSAFQITEEYNVVPAFSPSSGRVERGRVACVSDWVSAVAAPRPGPMLTGTSKSRDFYEDIRPTLMLYKVIGLTSLSNVFSGRFEFRWGVNCVWPLVRVATARRVERTGKTNSRKTRPSKRRKVTVKKGPSFRKLDWRGP